MKIVNSIPVSQLQKGDKVEYRHGSYLVRKQRFFTVTDIRDMNNGLIRLYLGRRNPQTRSYRVMQVAKGSEIRILV